MPPRRSRAATAGAAVLFAAVAASSAPAQETGGGRECTLTLEPTDSTRSVSRKVAPDAYVTHIGNGMTWLCDPATMTADSAVQYDRREEVVMMGSVHYRDTIRDLRSRRLTYFQRDNRVLAEDSVRLRQLETGAVLRGPRVEFYNAVRGAGPRRTVATRRPRMRIPSPGDTAGDPFRVVSDTAVFVGEEAAEAYGEVVIRRGPLTARGGYARFRIRDGSGYLTRSPSVRGEGYTLTGDTILVRFTGSELRAVRARGDGHLQTEDVEVSGPNVDVRIEDGQADELWAYGEGGARAFSARQEIRGDSLHFEVEGGQLTGITAVGRAVAVEIPPDASPAADSAPEPAAEETEAPASRPGPGLDRSWIAGDTVRAAFAAAAPDSAERDTLEAAVPAETDTAVAAAADTAPTARDTAGTELERLVAIGDARSFYRIRGDSAAAGEEDGERRTAQNYVIGDRITIRFRGGDPLSVHGTRAIGLFMEPGEGAGGTGTRDSAAAPDTAADPDTAGTGAADPAVPARDSAVPDTTRGRPPPRREARAGERGGTLFPMSGIRRTGGMIYE